MAKKADKKKIAKKAIKETKKVSRVTAPKKRVKKKATPKLKKPVISVKGWTDVDLSYLYQAKLDGMNYYLISSALKKPISEIKRVYNKIDWPNTKFYDKIKENVNSSLKAELVEKIACEQEKKIHSEKIKAEIIADRLERAVKPYPQAPPAWKPTGKKRSQHRPEDAVILLSDLHIGGHFTKEETGGLAEYDLDVFKSRAEKLKASTSDILELHSQLYDVPTLHIMSLGDIVHGMNEAGEWSHTYINQPVFDQMMDGCEAMAEMIYFWLGQFKEIKFYGVRGNHGRAAPRGMEKDYVNWDYVAYKFLESRFKDHKRVIFECPKSWWHSTTIRNHKFLLLHGDELAGGGGATGKLEAASMNMAGLTREIYDYTVGGHYHTVSEMATNFGKVIVNGSFIGADIYSLKSLQKGCKPTQRIFGVHDQRGITWSYDVNLS